MPTLGPNMLLSAVSNILGVRLDPYQSFNFFVEIAGIICGGFTECSGLQVETETFEYREGGVNEYMHRFAGATKYPPLILKHGLTPMDGLWAWHQNVTQNVIERKNGTIYLLNKQHVPVMWWDFKDAFPVKWTGPELRAENGSIAFESIELVHKGLSKPGLLGAIAGIGAELSASINISGGF